MQRVQIDNHFFAKFNGGIFLSVIRDSDSYTIEWYRGYIKDADGVAYVVPVEDRNNIEPFKVDNLTLNQYLNTVESYVGSSDVMTWDKLWANIESTISSWDKQPA